MAATPFHPAPGSDQLCLGIDGGATRTVGLIADAAGHPLGRVETRPTNLKLVSDGELLKSFREIARALPPPTAVGIGLAGAWDESDRKRIRQAAAICWPGAPCYATHDLEIALTAAWPFPGPQPEVLILSGTGSCCYGRNHAGRVAKVGGWGHTLGDQGSGYDIGLQSLRSVAEHYDRSGQWPSLGADLLQSLQLHAPNELIAWAQQAGKPEIAGLAITVFAAWGRKDRIAAGVIDAAARRLAADAATCAGKLGPRDQATQFVLAGSVLVEQPRFRVKVLRELRRLWPKAVTVPLAPEPAWGAMMLAQRLLAPGRSSVSETPRSSDRDQSPAPRWAEVTSRRLSPTEERNPRSLKLDKMPLAAAIDLMMSEDETIPRKLLTERSRIARAVRLIAQRLRNGGRLFYVGAGTSGRLGVLDASECPPTFNTPPELVQGIMAGGQVALWSSVEGGEDDRVAGGRAVAFRRVTRRDVVVGIAASGTTPFVWGALGEAKARGAATILVCFNPHLAIPRAIRPTVVIAPNLGPELLTGSTRLKAGTATKLLLNLFTTLAMVRLGKVMSNLMVDVHASNAKLRARAVRIVAALAGVAPTPAQAALEAHRWEIRQAVKALKSE